MTNCITLHSLYLRQLCLSSLSPIISSSKGHLPLINSNPISLFLKKHPDRSRECGKMCLHATNSLSEAHKAVSSSELPLFSLDEVGYSTNSRFILCVQILNRAENKISVMLTDDLAEDG